MWLSDSLQFQFYFHVTKSEVTEDFRFDLKKPRLRKTGLLYFNDLSAFQP